MSRYCSEKDIGPILSAAKEWRERCLLKGESLFGQEKIWNKKNIDDLVKYFVDNLESGEGESKFIPRLRQQLQHADPDVKKLAAEMYWVMMLCPHESDIGPKKKIINIKHIWGWSSDVFNKDNPLLKEPVLRGVSATRVGQEFLKCKKDLAYFVEMLSCFFSEDDQKKSDLMANGWHFAEWLENVPENNTRQLRHMLLFLLFPDDFERLFSDTLRREIAYNFLQNDDAWDMSQIEIDQFLLEKRKELEKKHQLMSWICLNFRPDEI